MKKPEQPYLQNPLLRLSYSLIAPPYDLVIERPMREARLQSLRALPTNENKLVLVSGVGTGLDLPLLPKPHRYTALDFNPAMLARARPRGETLDVDFALGDSMALPFADAQFDHVVLHLIVAVVPEPQRCLSEAARVLKSGGTIILFDKFLQPQQRAPFCHAHGCGVRGGAARRTGTGGGKRCADAGEWMVSRDRAAEKVERFLALRT